MQGPITPSFFGEGDPGGARIRLDDRRSGKWALILEFLLL